MYLPLDLKTAKNVFVCAPFTSTSLSLPHRGPYNVINRSDEQITLLRSNKDDHVSNDCTKLAYVDNDVHSMSKINLTPESSPIVDSNG